MTYTNPELEPECGIQTLSLTLTLPLIDILTLTLNPKEM